MIAEIGGALLWLALGAAVLQAGGALPRLGLDRLAGPAAVIQGWLWLWIAGAGIAVFVTTDLSVAGVAATSAAALPRGLKLAAVVVQPAGGWLVGAAVAAWAGAALAAARVRRAVVGAAGVASVALTVALLVAQPFARLSPAPTAGAGFPIAVRARLAALAPPGLLVIDTPLRLGAGANGVRLAAITPVAGSDTTGVAAELHAGGVVLVPEWRELNGAASGFPVAAHGFDRAGWWSATVVPRPDGRWRVAVTRLPAWWLAVAALLLVGGGWAWRRR